MKMPVPTTRSRFVFCVRNDAYPASLEVGKFYRTLSDAAGKAKGLVRIVDESGEDYLYPSDLFIPMSQVGRDALEKLSNETLKQREAHARARSESQASRTLRTQARQATKRDQARAAAHSRSLRTAKKG
jgi:hypothetical protein